MDITPIDADSEKAVAKALDGIGEISTLPEITLKIIETVEDPRSTARDLHEIVTHDLALSARILRVVNSAFYGLPGRVGSIDRAIVMLGLNAVKNIAIAASLTRVFRGGRISRKFSARDLWMHSVGVGVASKLTIEAMGMALPDEAFVAGLIHDIGLVVMLQTQPQALAEMMRMVESAQNEARDGGAGSRPGNAASLFTELERRMFGATHEAFGAGLARRWKFPRSFHYVTGYHHRPEQLARENRLLTDVIGLADSICARKEIGLVVPVDQLEIDPRRLASLGLTQTQLDAIEQSLPEQVDNAMALFS